MFVCFYERGHSYSERDLFVVIFRHEDFSSEDDQRYHGLLLTQVNEHTSQRIHGSFFLLIEIEY